MRRRAMIGGLLGAISPSTAARAQQALPAIGFLGTGSPNDLVTATTVATFREGLGQTGFYEGRNVRIEFRWAEGRYEALPSLAGELIESKVNVLAATGGYVSALAAKQATANVPIVFISGGDALRLGLVRTMNRPEGNLTGVNLFFGALGAKQMDLLRLMVPKADEIAMLANPTNPTSESDIAEVSRSASTIGVRLHVCLAATVSEIDEVLSGLSQRSIEAALIGDDPFLFNRYGQIVDKLRAQSIPAVSFAREFVASGGLMSYGASLVAGYRQVGLYVGAILRGAKVSDLPVIQPNTFTLAVNLRAARAIGLTVPVSVLVAADEVIE